MALSPRWAGPGSHTAIVAEGLGIPAVVGAGSFLSDVSGGETVIIDGDEGVIILRPDEETLARYRYEADEPAHPGRQTGRAKRATLRNARW